MVMAERKRLSRQDWVAAGLAALRREGPDAVAVEPLAVALETTKGSGYWHFANRAALLAAVMEAWRGVATAQVIDRVESAGGSPRERLHHLLVESTSGARTAAAELLIMGSADPTVRAVVEQVTEQRIRYVAALIEQGGVPSAEARTRAVLVYSAYLGGVTLTVAAPAVLARVSQQRMRDAVLDLALPPPPIPEPQRRAR